MSRLVIVVEGQGELKALPGFLWTLVNLGYFPPFEVLQVMRTPRDAFLRNPQERSRYLHLARKALGGEGGVLILLDADDLCPAQVAQGLGSELEGLASRLGLRVALVMPNREFEAWFLAAADGLGLGEVPEDPEDLRGAKEEVRKRLKGRYAPTVDQPRLATRLAQACPPEVLAQRSRSFRKFWKELNRLLLQG